MKRSEINGIISRAKQLLADCHFTLPPFADWTPANWQSRGMEASEIVHRGLGWDVTDFGAGNFARLGLLLFTLRNGSLANLQAGKGKIYAEKIMVLEPGQEVPLHTHHLKTEDIIVRGGGELVLEVFNSAADGSLFNSDVVVQMDGMKRTLKAGQPFTLKVGESITLEAGVYHKFYATRERVLAGEVSSVNDDTTDNRFLTPVGRFPAVEEDEAPMHLLVADYARWCPQLMSEF